MTQTVDELDERNSEAARAADEVLDEMASEYPEEDLRRAREAVERMQRRWVVYADDGRWIREVQRKSHEWRLDTIGDDITPMSQLAHTRNEMAELSDPIVKDDTYSDGWVNMDREHVPGGRREMMTEAGDVIVAYLGVLSLLDLDVVECVVEALEKNGQRDWDGWQEGGR